MIVFAVLLVGLVTLSIGLLIGIQIGIDRQDQAYHDHCSRIDEQLDREERVRRGEA